jgi:hypothetical protein
LDDNVVRVAVDTEYQGRLTLTVQAALRLGEAVAVQVYRDASIPDPPPDFDSGAAATRYRPFCAGLEWRPVKPLTPTLSPGRMLLDLLGLDEVCPSVVLGRPPLPAGSSPNAEVLGEKAGRLRLVLVGHSLRADIARFFGRHFLDALKGPPGRRPRLSLHGRRLYGLGRPGARGRCPAVERIHLDGWAIDVEYGFADTNLAFGPGTLEDLSRTFLGVGKCEAVSAEEKSRMSEVFRRRPADAYAYALADPVNTLLLEEEMRRQDRAIYRAFGVPEDRVPEMPGTVGRRASRLLLTAAEVQVAAGSSRLGPRAALRELASLGGPALLRRDPEASRFGAQTAGVHGGLLLNRSPARPWHEAPGLLADIDLASCYGRLASTMDVYFGRPLVLEPGAAHLSLREAVRLAREHADDDGWVIRVTGPLPGCFNTLIPSTLDVVTAAGYREARRRRRKRLLDGSPDAGPARQGSALFASCVEAGVVTAATWVVIGLLPKGLREHYERLRAETVLFYPRRLAARDGKEFDRLYDERYDTDPPWRAWFDVRHMRLVEQRRLDHEFVTLRFPLSRYAAEIGESRARARREQGKGSAAELAWKTLANCLYGALTSPHLPTGNVVAGNVITAAARASAWLMTMALNGLMTNTDGTVYHRGQVPAGTLAGCLTRRPNYPVSRAEEGDGVRFVKPEQIPLEAAAFTSWYRAHVARFFAARGENLRRLGDLLAVHELEHKPLPGGGPCTFDGLATDGAANTLKAYLAGGSFQVRDFRARGYGGRAKEALAGWLVQADRGDRLEGLPPVLEDRELLSLSGALREARAALREGRDIVQLPLGFARGKVLIYRLVRAPAFVFEGPRQRRAFLRQVGKFQQERCCGLELLALRRGYEGRPEGSLSGLLQTIERLVRGGTSNFSKALNLNKLGWRLEGMAWQRVPDIARRRNVAREVLWSEMEAAEELAPTAWTLTRADLEHLLAEREELWLIRPAAVPAIQPTESLAVGLTETRVPTP